MLNNKKMMKKQVTKDQKNSNVNYLIEAREELGKYFVRFVEDVRTR